MASFQERLRKPLPILWPSKFLLLSDLMVVVIAVEAGVLVVDDLLEKYSFLSLSLVSLARIVFWSGPTIKVIVSGGISCQRTINIDIKNAIIGQ